MEFWSAVICAYILDLVLGDPQWLPHPVRGIGWIVTRLEPVLRDNIKNKQTAGIFLAIIVTGITWSIVFFIVFLTGSIHPYAAWVCTVVFLYFAFAVKDLSVHGMHVYHALDNENIILARSRAGMIVGRDTGSLSREEIVRAAVETIAENTVDGIVAPLCYAFLGGAPLALAYKAVNTLDSMVGYRNERYALFGWASAKLDDIANFIPARITGICLPLAAFITGNDGTASFIVMKRDGSKHPSPNSGIPEAAMAGALNIKLGGVNYYKGVASHRAVIGNGAMPLTIEHIKKSIRISHVCALLIVIFITIVIQIIERG